MSKQHQTVMQSKKMPTGSLQHVTLLSIIFLDILPLSCLVNLAPVLASGLNALQWMILLKKISCKTARELEDYDSDSKTKIAKYPSNDVPSSPNSIRSRSHTGAGEVTNIHDKEAHMYISNVENALEQQRLTVLLKSAEASSNKAHATYMLMMRDAKEFDENNYLWKMYLEKERVVKMIRNELTQLRQSANSKESTMTANVQNQMP